jgi:lipoprotein LpqH
VPRRRFCTVRTRLLAGAATALALAGCSSGPPEYQPGPGMLVAGTAQVTVNGQDAGTTDAVQCDSTGTLTTITTGDQASGVIAMVSNKDQLTAESVAIRDLGGFTGSYNAGFSDAAKVTMNGRTYEISGTADGFETDSPSFRKSGTFSIKVSC